MPADSPIFIEACDSLDQNQMIIHFSDETSAIFTTQDLLACAHKRIRIRADDEVEQVIIDGAQ